MQYEYQIIEIKPSRRDDKLTALVKALNRFGREGWRLHEFQVDPIRVSNERTYRLLLEREIPEAPADSESELA